MQFPAPIAAHPRYIVVGSILAGGAFPHQLCAVLFFFFYHSLLYRDDDGMQEMSTAPVRKELRTLKKIIAVLASGVSLDLWYQVYITT